MGPSFEKDRRTLKKCEKFITGERLRLYIPEGGGPATLDLSRASLHDKLPPPSVRAPQNHPASVEEKPRGKGPGRGSREATPQTVKELIAVLEEASEASKEEKTDALRGLRDISTLGDRAVQCLLQLGAVQVLLTELQQGDALAKQLASATLLNISLPRKLRQILKETDSSLMPTLVQSLTSEFPDVTAHAAATLTCLISVHGVPKEMLTLGAVPLLEACLSNSSLPARHESLSCLLRLSAFKFCRDSIFEAKVLQRVCKLLHKHKYIHDEQAAGILDCLSREPQGQEALLEAKAIPLLAELLECGATELARQHALLVLWVLASQWRDCIEEIKDEGVESALYALAHSRNEGINVKALALLTLLGRKHEDYVVDE